MKPETSAKASMTSSEMRGIGHELFGDHWQGTLARALDVNPRTIRRWASGEIEIPDAVADEIRKLVK